MEFLFHLLNHNAIGARSLEDVIGIMGKQMRCLGHKLVWDQRNVVRPDGSYSFNFLTGDRGYNVIVEGFTSELIEKVIAPAHRIGVRFICIATEEPTPRGFNHGIQREMVLRQEVFPQAAQYFDGILHLVPGKHVTDWYGQFAPTAQAELGYAPTLVRPETVREPEFDFGFFGSVSPRRMRLLRALQQRSRKRTAVSIVSDFPDQTTRDLRMADAKVIVQIRKDDAMGLVSSSRCNTALHLNRPVVAEPHELSKPWDDVIKFARTESEFLNLCSLTLSMWRSVHAQQMEKFKEKLSPEFCVGEPLRKIGIFDQARAAA